MKYYLLEVTEKDGAYQLLNTTNPCDPVARQSTAFSPPFAALHQEMRPAIPSQVIYVANLPYASYAGLPENNVAVPSQNNSFTLEYTGSWKGPSQDLEGMPQLVLHTAFHAGHLLCNEYPLTIVLDGDRSLQVR